MKNKNFQNFGFSHKNEAKAHTSPFLLCVAVNDFAVVILVFVNKFIAHYGDVHIYIHKCGIHTYICMCMRMIAINFRHSGLCHHRDSHGALTAHMLAVGVGAGN